MEELKLTEPAILSSPAKSSGLCPPQRAHPIRQHVCPYRSLSILAKKEPAMIASAKTRSLDPVTATRPGEFPDGWPVGRAFHRQGRRGAVGAASYPATLSAGRRRVCDDNNRKYDIAELPTRNKAVKPWHFLRVIMSGPFRATEGFFLPLGVGMSAVPITPLVAHAHHIVIPAERVD
jgi:hypothetical protein